MRSLGTVVLLFACVRAVGLWLWLMAAQVCVYVMVTLDLTKALGMWTPTPWEAGVRQLAHDVFVYLEPVLGPRG